MAARLHAAGCRLVVGDASPAATQAILCHSILDRHGSGSGSVRRVRSNHHDAADSDAVESVLLGAPGRTASRQFSSLMR
jgi:hypothetical protein